VTPYIRIAFDAFDYAVKGLKQLFEVIQLLPILSLKEVECKVVFVVYWLPLPAVSLKRSEVVLRVRSYRKYCSTARQYPSRVVAIDR
jgi:hypothetical protein